jgi:GNAT superfamily N-acetyltransferase
LHTDQICGRGFDLGRCGPIVRDINIKIRNASRSDSAIIASFNVRMGWETEQRRLNRARVQRGVHALLMDATKGTYYVAELDGAVVGQLLITHEWSDWRNGNFWWIQSVYVAPEFRRRGLFRALFNHVYALAKAQPEVCGLRLYMHARNGRARRAYEHLGMKHSDYEVFEMDFVLP